MRVWWLAVVLVGLIAAPGCKKKAGDKPAPPAGDQPGPAVAVANAPPVLGLKGMPVTREQDHSNGVGRGLLPPGWLAGTIPQGPYAAPQGWNRVDSETHLDEPAPCGETEGCTMFVLRLASPDGAAWVEVAVRRGEPASAADWVKAATAAPSTQDRVGWACGEGVPDNAGDPAPAAACAKKQGDGSLLTETLVGDEKTYKAAGGLASVEAVILRTGPWKSPPAAAPAAAAAPEPASAPEDE